MKLDTAVRRLTSAEGGHSPHPVSAGLLLLKQYWTFFSGQFGHKHHFSGHCRLDPDENQMDLSIWSYGNNRAVLALDEFVKESNLQILYSFPLHFS